ncbi:mechanosensitive ion channel family protein [Candidatus Woesearchaeota archaeon]|nr:mechanosensitive ion channel family protein [Candidatus Woesearchaeota archaeon]
MKKVNQLQIKWYKALFPIILLIIFFVAYNIFPNLNLGLEDELQNTLRKILLSIVFLLGGWTINKIINLLIKQSLRRHDITKQDNLKERSILTRMRYVRIIINIIIILISLALALRQFEGMRQLSTSILASAGIIGIMLAFSAQKILANILAGFEIAFTQPIRIDDVVIVEGEWGKIEEINATHVVVRIWDQRRLVLPITYFVEKPFQNWTKTSADIWGTTEFYVDYSMSIDAMRKQLTTILKKTNLWDGKINSVQVTETNDKTMKVRALMSAKNSGDAWDLRCKVREEMIRFLQEKHPEKLPRLRAEVMGKQAHYKK